MIFAETGGGLDQSSLSDQLPSHSTRLSLERPGAKDVDASKIFHTDEFYAAKLGNPRKESRVALHAEFRNQC